MTSLTNGRLTSMFLGCVFRWLYIEFRTFVSVLLLIKMNVQIWKRIWGKQNICRMWKSRFIKKNFHNAEIFKMASNMAATFQVSISNKTLKLYSAYWYIISRIVYPNIINLDFNFEYKSISRSLTPWKIGKYTA